MPLSHEHDPEHDDEQLTRYLLGLLPEREAEEMDAASVVDDDVAARLRVIENDLIDSYVRGRLASPRLEQFESWYLSSSRRRESVAFARNFLDAVDRSAEPAGAVENAPAPAAQAAAAPMAEAPVRAGVAAHSVVWLLTAAAAVLVAVFGTLRFRAGDHARPSSPVAEARVPATGRMSAGNGASADSRQAAPWPAASSQPLDAAAPKRDVRIVALELFPQTRAVATIPALAIPAGARDLELRLRLESSDFRRYQAGLHDPATNEVVWRSAWTAAGPDRDRPYVRIVIPAGMLKPQHYSLDLAGRGEAGEPEIVGSYAFEVLPP